MNKLKKTLSEYLYMYVCMTFRKIIVRILFLIVAEATAAKNGQFCGPKSGN
jgi:hypothetical protein